MRGVLDAALLIRYTAAFFTTSLSGFGFGPP
jgi:hypothetical protein